MEKLNAQKLGLQHGHRYYCTLIGSDYEGVRYYSAWDDSMHYSKLLICRAGKVEDYESIEDF
jgi:hypothetical protein